MALQPGEQRKPRKNGKKRSPDGVIADVTGDTFLLQASVVLCGCAACGWAVLQVILYRSSEPAMVIIPLLYPLANGLAVVYERFRSVSFHRHRYGFMSSSLLRSPTLTSAL